MPDDERPPTGSETEPADAGRAWAKWGSVGFEFGAAVLLFFLLGSWLDARWGTHPWMRVVGALVGIAAGTYALIRQALRSSGDKPSPTTERSENTRPPRT
jgi:F0F1-type ATP synthase assembly protein I